MADAWQVITVLKQTCDEVKRRSGLRPRVLVLLRSDWERLFYGCNGVPPPPAGASQGTVVGLRVHTCDNVFDLADTMRRYHRRPPRRNKPLSLYLGETGGIVQQLCEAAACDPVEGPECLIDYSPGSEAGKGGTGGLQEEAM